MPTQDELFEALRSSIARHKAALSADEQGFATWHIACHRTAQEIERAYGAWRATWSNPEGDRLFSVLSDLMEAVDSLVEGTPELDPIPFNPELLARARTVLAEAAQERAAATG